MNKFILRFKFEMFSSMDYNMPENFSMDYSKFKNFSMDYSMLEDAGNCPIGDPMPENLEELCDSHFLRMLYPAKCLLRKLFILKVDRELQSRLEEENSKCKEDSFDDPFEREYAACNMDSYESAPKDNYIAPSDHISKFSVYDAFESRTKPAEICNLNDEWYSTWPKSMKTVVSKKSSNMSPLCDGFDIRVNSFLMFRRRFAAHENMFEDEESEGIELLASSLTNDCAVTPTTNEVPKNSSITKAFVKYTYKPERDDELGLTKGHFIAVTHKTPDGWWRGAAINGDVGWFPASYVEEVQISLEIGVARYSYNSSSTDELTFKKGDRFEIIKTSGDNWWQARNEKGETGFVPYNYIEFVAPTSSSTLTSSSTQDNEPQFSDNADMDVEPWYFGGISTNRAEELLNHGREGEFLVRDSEANPGHLSISIRGIERIKHIEIRNKNDQLRIENQTFTSMESLITYYTTNLISTSSTGNLYLSSPLPK